MANTITFISIIVTFALAAAYTMTILVTVAHIVTIATPLPSSSQLLPQNCCFHCFPLFKISLVTTIIADVANVTFITIIATASPPP